MTPNEIAEVITLAIENKSFIPIWSYALLVILPLFGAFLGAYVKRKADDYAIAENFKSTLKRIEKQVNSVKEIEERISHVYLEEREITRVKREKLEDIYVSLEDELELLIKNKSIAMADMKRDITYPSNKVQMLVSLYFKEGIKKELELYIEHRNYILTYIREICEKNLYRNNQQLSIQENMKTMEHSSQLISNLNKAKINLELSLEQEMKNLTRRSS